MSGRSVNRTTLFLGRLRPGDEPLSKDLTRAASDSLTDKTEAEVLAAIRKLAVREENTMVARVASGSYGSVIGSGMKNI